MSQKRRKPRPTVATKQEFLGALEGLERQADYLYQKWHGRPNDNHFFLVFDLSLPYSAHMAHCVVRASPEYGTEAVKSASGREWAVMLVADALMDRILELPFSHIGEIGEWFERVKGKRPRFVPLLGFSVLGDRANEIWRIEYEPDPENGLAPSAN
jgi:hypothetical protein